MKPLTTGARLNPLTPDPWTELRRLTPARIAIGRVGASQPTQALLEFGLAHAQARDAVHTPLQIEPLSADLQADGWTVLRVHSRAPDRAHYLRRPDLGRRLSDASAQLLSQLASGGRSPQQEPRTRSRTDTQMNAPAQRPWNADINPAAVDPADTDAPSLLVFVVADGLSATAVQRHARPLLQAVRRELASSEFTLGPVVIAEQTRVALGDEVGQCLGAQAVVLLVGERPGLSSPDSLGIYLTWAPRVGRMDSERNCISNIRPEGLPPAQAARILAGLLAGARRLGATGVALKDDSPALLDSNPSAHALSDCSSSADGLALDPN